MLKNFKSKLYNLRLSILFNLGIEEGFIEYLDDSFFELLKGHYFAGIPLNIHLRYFMPNNISGGRCDKRARMMLFAFENATLVFGNLKGLKLEHGSDAAWHFWVENDDLVYDPTSLCVYDKKYFYLMHEVEIIKSIDFYNLIDDPLINNIKECNIKDYMPGGMKSFDLLARIPILEEMAKSNESLNKDLMEYKKLIKYNSEELISELDKKLMC